MIRSLRIYMKCPGSGHPVNLYGYSHLHSTMSNGARHDSVIDRASDCRFSGHKLESQLPHITFMKIDHEIIS